MKLTIRTPTGNTRGPLATESLLRAMHRASESEFSFSIRSVDRQTELAVDIPVELRTLFLQELQDSYPGVTVTAQQPLSLPQQAARSHCRLRVSPDFLRLRTYDEFLDISDGRSFTDPVAGLFSALRSQAKDPHCCELTLTVRPASQCRLRLARKTHDRWRDGFRRLTLERAYLWLYFQGKFYHRIAAALLGKFAHRSTAMQDTVETKLDELLFECDLSISVVANQASHSVTDRKIREVVTTLGRFHAGAKFEVGQAASSLLSCSEIATLWHPLTESADTVAGVSRSSFKELEPPIAFTSRRIEGDGTVLGRLKFRRQQQQFQIYTDDLRRHLIAVGKTGCGKSTFLLNLIRQQMEAGKGIVLFDPHGQLADDVLNYVPKHRTNDVIYFDAGDMDAPVGFNPMIGPEGTSNALIADAVLSSFKNVFGLDAGSAPRLLHIFRNTLLTLIDTPHASLAAVQRMLVDAPFRKSMAGRVDNTAVRSFWTTEFNRWNERDRTQYVASLQNKI